MHSIVQSWYVNILGSDPKCAELVNAAYSQKTSWLDSLNPGEIIWLYVTPSTTRKA
jgi:hypothetical protein